MVWHEEKIGLHVVVTRAREFVYFPNCVLVCQFICVFVCVCNISEWPEEKIGLQVVGCELVQETPPSLELVGKWWQPLGMRRLTATQLLSHALVCIRL